MLAQQAAGPAPATLEEIAAHQARFAWIARGAIIVSFLHQADALARFGDPENWLHTLAAWAMTLLVDVVTWQLGEYMSDAQRRDRVPSLPLQALFVLAILTAMALNGVFLWTHQPPPDVLPSLLSGFVVVVFAVFVPLVILGCGVARAELEADRATARAAEGQQRTLEQQVREARAQLAQAQAQVRDAQAKLAQQEAEAREARAAERSASAQAAQHVGQLAHLQAEARAAVAQAERRAAQEVAQLRAELEAARAATGADLATVARRLAAEGVGQRAIARALERSESTVRGWVKAAAAPALLEG